MIQWRAGHVNDIIRVDKMLRCFVMHDACRDSSHFAAHGESQGGGHGRGEYRHFGHFRHAADDHPYHCCFARSVPCSLA